MSSQQKEFTIVNVPGGTGRLIVVHPGFYLQAVHDATQQLPNVFEVKTNDPGTPPTASLHKQSPPYSTHE